MRDGSPSALLLILYLVTALLSPVQPDFHLSSDVVIAVPSCVAYLDVVHATRPFRLGIRTFITLDKEDAARAQNEQQQQSTGGLGHREMYAFVPDNPKVRHKKNWRLHEGRWLLTPFLAHEQYRGQYKWLLLGDDDTLWLLSGVASLLGPYDASLPYYITDSVAELQSVVGEKAPRIAAGRVPTATLCLPCHTPDAEIDALRAGFPEGSAAWGLAWRGCPCTAAQGCAHRHAMCELLPELRGRFVPAFSGIVSPANHSVACSPGTSAYGGAGMVLSASLLAALPATAARTAAPTQYTWGDYALAQMAFAQGYSITFPDAALEATGVLDERHHRLFGHGGELVQALVNGADGSAEGSTVATICSHLPLVRNCSWTLSHAASVHLRHKGQLANVTERLRGAARALGRALDELGVAHEYLQDVEVGSD